MQILGSQDTCNFCSLSGCLEDDVCLFLVGVQTKRISRSSEIKVNKISYFIGAKVCQSIFCFNIYCINSNSSFSHNI